MADIAAALRRRTFKYALEILTFCRHLPNTWEAREIGRQLLRSGMGVTGNYWSACRGRSDREFIAKLGVAVDESEESLLWLTLLVKGGVSGSNDTQARCCKKERSCGRFSQNRIGPHERTASRETSRRNRGNPRNQRTRRSFNSPTHQIAKFANFSAGTP
jgi:four helix bundle protein